MENVNIKNILSLTANFLFRCMMIAVLLNGLIFIISCSAGNVFEPTLLTNIIAPMIVSAASLAGEKFIKETK